jgi:phosphatidylserine/phosphatidylglycerophosphate/cardiolipin synthase-like enzyme
VGDGATSSFLKPGRNCWRIAHADRAAMIVDAADYYAYAFDAMLRARSQILLIGWDVDTRVHLLEEKEARGAPTQLGALLTWLSKHRPGLEATILAWDEGLLSLPTRGTTIFRLMRWWRDPKVRIKWDHSHPLDGSHHQKLLIIDDQLAFCGGIDITGDRWDTRHHRDNDPGRRTPFTGRSYEPWHDATMAVGGEAARALGDLGRERWKCATGKEMAPASPGAGEALWPEGLEPHFRDVPVAIARTLSEDGPIEEVREVEALFADMIAAAKKHVYIETQYFSSRIIAEAIAKRLEEPLGPEFVIINPKTALGWLDEEVMGAARAELFEALTKRDSNKRFRIYCPVTEGGADIYVHAKIMIVDDVALRVGSANFNNRSMGLDSECDIIVDGSGSAETRKGIAGTRADLLAEHFGRDPKEVGALIEETDSLIATVERLRGAGRTLVPFVPPEFNALERRIAKSERLDPEGPDELFEKRARPGLLRTLGRG